MIKAIIFDVGGVLKTHTDGAVQKDIKETLKLSDREFEDIYLQNISKVIKGELTEKEFWTLVLQELGKPYTDEVNELFSRGFEKSYKQNKEVVLLARKLKENGYTIAILSNTIPSHCKINEEEGTYDGFEIKIFSHEVHAKKPEKEIYLAAIEQLKINPEEAIFIDDIKEYTDTASDLGINGIHYIDYQNLLLDLEKLEVKIK